MPYQFTAESQIDITYHYPPELLELLCDAVPALFRSKLAVTDFFKGAGAPRNFLAEWIVKFRQDKPRCALISFNGQTPSVSNLGSIG